MGLKKFLRRFQVEYLLQVLKDTGARFPLSVACCALSVVICILEVHDVAPWPDDAQARLMAFLAYGLVFFTSVRVYIEGAKLPRAREWALDSTGGALLLALCFIPEQMTAMHLFTGAALSLSMLFSPYIGRNSTEDSVWYYNYMNGISLAVAGLSTFILCLGLCAVIGSMDYLLYDMKLSGKIYGDIWLFGGLFFGPVMFMHQMSRQFDFEKSECALLPGIYFIANFLVVPLILIYMWVLYVYFLKIAVQWELPKGNLAYMVTGFGSLGIAARFAVFPMRDTGTKLLQQFYRFFYYILIVPLILLSIGLYTRISQYGVTEERYAIGICLTWLAALTVWYIARPERAHIKHVPMALAVLFLFAAAGPWGAVSVSTFSQTARLEKLLEKAGVVSAEGKVAKTAQEVPFELRKDISGILDYMNDGKREAIKGWTEPFRAEIEKKYKAAGADIDPCRARRFTGCYESYDMPRHVMEAWGMEYVGKWESEESQYINIQSAGRTWYDDNIQKAAPFEYIVRVTPSIYAGPWNAEYPYKENGVEKFKAKLAMTQAGDFSITLSDGRAAHFALQKLAEALRKDKLTVVPETESARLILRDDASPLKAEVRVSELHGRYTGGNFRVEGGALLVLFTP